MNQGRLSGEFKDRTRASCPVFKILTLPGLFNLETLAVPVLDIFQRLENPVGL